MNQGSIVTTEHEKDPDRVEASKILATMSKQAKEKKKGSFEVGALAIGRKGDTTRRERYSSKTNYSSMMLVIVAAVGVILWRTSGRSNRVDDL